MNELARIDNYCTLNTTNLTFKRDVSKEEWMDVFKALKQVEGCVQFWIGDCLAYRQQKWGMYDDIAEETGYDKTTLRHIKDTTENIENVRRRTELSFSHHVEVASLPPEKQEIFLQKAVEEHLSVRDLRQAIRVDGNTSSTPELKKDKKYRVIYADPPWSYGNQMPKGTTTPSDYYNTMSTGAICALPVRDITDDNAILFLWTTSPHLRESFDVIDAWGFDYKTSFIWDKVKHNMGHYNSVRHEFLLICVKGSCTPDNIQLFDSVVSIERTEHSIKPEYFREIIDTLYTWGNKIELFARTTVAGWEVYGNEV
jgi:N6-adenosine-specific RNA methylase IME4